MSSNTEVKDIIYHCQCRRFVEGLPNTPCFCSECGREFAPDQEFGWTGRTQAAV